MFFESPSRITNMTWTIFSNLYIKFAFACSYMFSRPDSFKNQVMFRCLQYHCCYKYFIYSYQNIVFNAWLLYNTSLNLKRSAFVMKNLSYLKTSLPETDMIINDNRIIFQTDKWKADLIYVKEVSDVHLTR